MPGSVVCQHFQRTSPLKPWDRFFSYFAYSSYRFGAQIMLSSSWIRTLIAMAAYSFHILIMYKVEIGNFCCLNEGIWNFLLQKYLSRKHQQFKLV